MSESIRIDSEHLSTLRRIAKMQKIPLTRAMALAVEALEEQLEIRAINRAQTPARRARDLKMLAATDKAARPDTEDRDGDALRGPRRRGTPGL